MVGSNRGSVQAVPSRLSVNAKGENFASPADRSSPVIDTVLIAAYVRFKTGPLSARHIMLRLPIAGGRGIPILSSWRLGSAPEHGVEIGSFLARVTRQIVQSADKHAPDLARLTSESSVFVFHPPDGHHQNPDDNGNCRDPTDPIHNHPSA